MECRASSGGAGESSSPQVRRSASAERSPRRSPRLRLIADVTQLLTITGRCRHDKVCILASASTIAAAFGGCHSGISANGSQVA